MALASGTIPGRVPGSREYGGYGVLISVSHTDNINNKTNKGQDSRGEAATYVSLSIHFTCCSRIVCTNIQTISLPVLIPIGSRWAL